MVQQHLLRALRFVLTKRWANKNCLAAVLACSSVGTLGCQHLPDGIISPQHSMPSTVEKNETSAKFAMARLMDRHGQIDQARTAYEKLLVDQPKNPEIHHRLAVLYDRLGNQEKSKLHFHQAIELNPNSANIRNDFGYWMMLQEKWKEAETQFQAALAIDSDHPQARRNLALAMGYQGRTNDSWELFRRAGSKAEAYANVAFILAQQGDIQQAHDYYIQALKLNPQLKVAAQGLVQINDALNSEGKPNPPGMNPKQEAYARSKPNAALENAKKSIELESFPRQTTPTFSQQPLAQNTKPETRFNQNTNQFPTPSASPALTGPRYNYQEKVQLANLGTHTPPAIAPSSTPPTWNATQAPANHLAARMTSDRSASSNPIQPPNVQPHPAYNSAQPPMMQHTSAPAMPQSFPSAVESRPMTRPTAVAQTSPAVPARQVENGIPSSTTPNVAPVNYSPPMPPAVTHAVPPTYAAPASAQAMRQPEPTINQAMAIPTSSPKMDEQIPAQPTNVIKPMPARWNPNPTTTQAQPETPATQYVAPAKPAPQEYPTYVAPAHYLRR